MNKYPQFHKKAKLKLANDEIFEGFLFGFPASTSGEVVFNTGMVGYPETLTDPSYYGEILVSTFPLIGNYGVPATKKEKPISDFFESDKVHIKGLVISDYSSYYSHWNAEKSLNDWLIENKIVGLCNVDTRKLTRLLREDGTMLGKIIVDDNEPELFDPNSEDLVSQVCPKEIIELGEGKKKILLVDCGCKNNIIRSLLERNVKVIRVPATDDFTKIDCDGFVISNGPGNPAQYSELVDKVSKVLESKKPVLGICLGHQLIALASGASTYKLKYGHRSQNQPVIDIKTNRSFITSQNHGFAVEERGLGKDWQPWFKNLNDGTNEGIIHNQLPIMSVQFHPEASPGPVDTSFIFDEFIKQIK